jgi:ATP phosphoribosyltransferase
VAEFLLSAEDGHGEINEILELGFGKCSLQVQVPEVGSLQSVENLVGKRIVTSFVGLTRKYFADLEKRANVSATHTQIKYVGGSVEAACALGVADGIVDLVGMLQSDY